MDLWPKKQRVALEEMISIASKDPQAFAVFDADNTLWHHDVEEALIAWMDFKSIIDLSQMNSYLLPIPPLRDESAYGYYSRLSQKSHASSYLWAVQTLAGFSLKEIQNMLDEMMSFKGLIPTTRTLKTNDRTEKKECFIETPTIFPAQSQLIKTLQKNNINVWVVSASAEDLVRMLCSNPHYGLCIPPEKIIGVNMLLTATNGAIFSSAEERIRGEKGFEYYFSEQRMNSRMTHHLYTPATWYSGKVSGIKEWIHPSKRPFLVAGDSPNDFYMQFYADVNAGGIRLRITKNPKHKEDLRAMQQLYSEGPQDEKPYKGWVEVSPNELLGKEAI